MIAIRNGSVLTRDGMIEADLLIDQDRITRVGGSFDADTTLDAAGAWVGPGLVDLHAHFREPGQEWKEDIESGSRAAISGGFTAVVTMPNTEPAIDAGHRARYVIERARQVGLCQVVPAGAITMGRSGEVMSHLEEMWEAGVRIFSDDGSSVSDAGLLRLVMDYVAEKGGVIAQHAEDLGLSNGGHMHEGAVSSWLGIRGIPALAEEVVVARDLALAQVTGVRYHVQHASTQKTVSMVAAAKLAGLPITVEVSPHHLSFHEQNLLTMDPAYKMYPPLRTATDAAALANGLRDGTIDAVATDHAPHAAFETEVPFEEAPRGVIGLETAAAAVNSSVGLAAESFFARLSIDPARIAGLADQGLPVEEGNIANLVVFDPDLIWRVESFRSKAANSPFLGRDLQGMVLATIFEGRLTHARESVGS
ncbi:MAG: dihydroorotase [Actinomycetota bacterium]